MKLNNKFLLHISNDETFIIPSGEASFAGVIRGNKTLGVIASLLEHNITEDEIIRAMCKSYDAPEGMIERDVRKAINNLKSVGAITD